jgi:hypothetical protein
MKYDTSWKEILKEETADNHTFGFNARSSEYEIYCFPPKVIF